MNIELPFLFLFVSVFFSRTADFSTTFVASEDYVLGFCTDLP